MIFINFFLYFFSFFVSPLSETQNFDNFCLEFLSMPKVQSMIIKKQLTHKFFDLGYRRKIINEVSYKLIYKIRKEFTKFCRI